MVTRSGEIKKAISKKAEKQGFIIQKKGGDSFERSGIQGNRSQHSGHDLNDVRDVSQTGFGKVRRGKRL